MVGTRMSGRIDQVEFQRALLSCNGKLEGDAIGEAMDRAYLRGHAIGAIAQGQVVRTQVQACAAIGDLARSDSTALREEHAVAHLARKHVGTAD
ncbi:MAG: hypothetical protein EOP93_15190, partial [Lysobacteraceae bacterium]